jgi:hypothetical protein
MVAPLFDEAVGARREFPRFLALVRKHAIQMMRRRQELFCNIGIPVLLAIGLAFLLKQSAGDLPFEETEVFEEHTYAPLNVLAPWLKPSMDEGSTLWFVNSSGRASLLVDRLLRPTRRTIDTQCTACALAPFLCEPACPLIKFARDEDELQRNLETNPETFWAGVVIEATEANSRHAKLTIRMPDSTMTDSRLLRVTTTDLKRRPRIAIAANGESEYITSGFASLQYAMQIGIGNALLADSSAVDSSAANANESSTTDTATRAKPSVAASVKLSKMPHAGFVRKANKIVFGQFLVLMFVPMSVNLARSVSDEKTNGVRTLLSLTGLAPSTWWLSWYAVWTCMGALVAVVCFVACAVLTLQGPISYLIISVTLLLLGLVWQGFGICSGFSRPALATLFNLVLTYGAIFLYLLVVVQLYVPDIVVRLLLCIPAVSFVEAISQLSTGFDSIYSEDTSVGISFQAERALNRLGIGPQPAPPGWCPTAWSVICWPLRTSMYSICAEPRSSSLGLPVCRHCHSADSAGRVSLRVAPAVHAQLHAQAEAIRPPLARRARRVQARPVACARRARASGCGLCAYVFAL